MTLPKVRETDQTNAESQLMNKNIDHQDIGPPQDGNVAKFQERITMNKNDTESATGRTEGKLARTLTYLKRAIKFGKRAKFYMTMLTSVKNLPEMSPKYLNSINSQISMDYANLSINFYTIAYQNGQAVDYTYIGPPQDWKVDEFQEWITVDKNDTESAIGRPEDKFARTLTYLKEAMIFGKRAKFYMTMLTSVENLAGKSPTFLDSINTQVRLDFADLANDYYTNALKNGQAVECTLEGEQTGRKHCS